MTHYPAASASATLRASSVALVLIVSSACHTSASSPAPAPAPSPSARPAREALAKADLIVVQTPTPQAVVTSPLQLTGTARGGWYFEATFPVKLFDAQGKLLAHSYAQAKGEWMTERFVPFAAELPFSPPATSTGTLVLEKANASGLAEHAGQLVLPVRFRPAQ